MATLQSEPPHQTARDAELLASSINVGSEGEAVFCDGQLDDDGGSTLYVTINDRDYELRLVRQDVE